MSMKPKRSVRLDAWTLLLSIALLAGAGARGSAQGPNQVAVIVQYEDGSVSTHCVSFDTPQITGLEALEQTGLDAVYEGGALGARVCKIGPVGCDLPGNCFCQCKGTECLYWSYWHLVEGTWQYAIVGAASYEVAPGGVEGWSWGIGTPNRAPQPPLISFEEVCQTSSATPPTATPPPTETPTHTRTPRPTETARPKETPTGTATRAPEGEGQPSPTPTQPASTPTAGPTRTPSLVPTQAAEERPTETPPLVPTTTRATHMPAAPPAPDSTNYFFFGAVVLVLLALGAYVLLRRR